MIEKRRLMAVAERAIKVDDLGLGSRGIVDAVLEELISQCRELPFNHHKTERWLRELRDGVR